MNGLSQLCIALFASATFLSVCAAAQADTVDSKPSLPVCTNGFASVHVRSPVRALETRAYVTGLTPDKFRLTSGSTPLPIQCFSEPDGPYTVGFVLDYSSSIHGSTGRFAVEGIREFIRLSNPKNTYFGIGFKGKPFLMLAPTNKQSEIDEYLVNAEKQDRSGSSSVNDAVENALQTMPSVNPDRRIIILVSDGQDNASRKRNQGTILKALRQAGVRVFVVTVARNNQEITTETSRGFERLSGYARETGGGWLSGSIKIGLSRSLAGLALILRGEYTFGFTPAKIEEKWHPIDYAVKVPKEFQKISMAGDRGFFY